MKLDRTTKWLKPIMMLTACLIWGAASVLAQSLPQLRPLNPAPNLQEPLPAEKGTEELSFDGNGTIDRIGDGQIVIGDRLWRLAPGVDYRSRSNGPAFGSQFRAGSVVRYKQNSKREIVTLWLMREKR